MRLSRLFIFSISLILFSSFFQVLQAQLGFDLKVDKPQPYEERVLRAEKSGEKPLRKPKRFFQNLTTHYNYYFNATTKLNEVIEGAKQSFRDDFTELLPFYNYTLDATAQDSIQLDSVIYKAKTGIVMHDLRNDWIDNLYLLWGAAWFFEQKFDSAALMFQFINYSFAEKEKDGYYRYIGSRMDGNNALSISTKENRRFPKNLVTPPSRNNAFIWQIRTLIESGDFAQSGSLISTLKNDPLFPSRLDTDLEEVQAYWFYKQQVWDSAAVHLILALDQAATKQERSRWEFLIAQLLERSGRFSEAGEYYTKSIGHTTDPVMEVYARLNLVRINKDGGENYIDKNIEELLKMARRDKYEDYRDVIYFMAAQMEMERNNFGAAQELLLKGAKYNQGNLASRNKSFLMIADLSYDQKKYSQAASYYDSVDVRSIQGPAAARVEERKLALAKYVVLAATVNRLDSLQRIAAMPEEERTAFITKLVKQLRKQQGLDDIPMTGGNAGPGNTNSPVDIFPTQQRGGGEWYFYNSTLKTQGAQQFKQAWGTRPNVDNWRRFADVNQQMVNKAPNNTRGADKAADASQAAADNTPSLNSLLKNLPLTPELMKISNDSLRTALFGLGMTYLNEIQDYPSAVETFEKIRTRFPDAENMNEVLFHLYYAYKKAGDEAAAARIKNLLTSRAPDSRFATILTTGKDPEGQKGKNPETNKAYEAIYDLFIEGRFEEAQAAKKQADSMYQTNYWNPQLLYIEAVYLIRQRQDSAAKLSLQTLIGQDPKAPMAVKAKNLIDVLNRRAEIEDELNRLQIQRPAEDSLAAPLPLVVQQQTTPIQTLPKKDTAAGGFDTIALKKPAVQPPVVQQPVVQVPKDTTVRKTTTVAVDTVARKPITTRTDTVAKKPAAPLFSLHGYTHDPNGRHQVVIILDKVDPLFANEVKTAFNRYNLDKYPGRNFSLETRELDADKKLVLVSEFANAAEAVAYAQAARQRAPAEILPWLKAEKYSFSILSVANLPILLEKKDMIQYKQFLDQILPGKF